MKKNRTIMTGAILSGVFLGYAILSLIYLGNGFEGNANPSKASIIISFLLFLAMAFFTTLKASEKKE